MLHPLAAHGHAGDGFLDKAPALAWQPLQLPGVPWAHQHLSHTGRQRGLPDEALLLPGPGNLGGGSLPRSLCADPACAEALCCDFGQTIPGVAGPSRPENSRAGLRPRSCNSACFSVKSTWMSLPLASRRLGALFPGRRRLTVALPLRVHCQPRAPSQPGARGLQPRGEKTRYPSRHWSHPDP